MGSSSHSIAKVYHSLTRNPRATKYEKVRDPNMGRRRGKLSKTAEGPRGLLPWKLKPLPRLRMGKLQLLKLKSAYKDLFMAFTWEECGDTYHRDYIYSSISAQKELEVNDSSTDRGSGVGVWRQSKRKHWLFP